MPRYAVDVSTWFYVDTENADDAYDMVHEHLCGILDDFEIVNVEEGV